VRKITARVVGGVILALALIAPAPAQGPIEEARQAQRRGAELQREGDLQGALREFERAVVLAPGAPLAWFNRGLVQRALGNCRAAADDFSRALELQPDFFNALYQRGNCMQALGATGRAVEDYTRAVAIPGRIDARFLAYFGRADAYRRLGRLEEADADYTRVLGLRTDTTALRSRAWVSYYRGLWSAAYEDAAKYVHDTEGKEPDAAYVIALGVLALRREGQAAKAATFLEQWQPRITAPPWPSAVLAYLKNGDTQVLLSTATNAGERTEALAYIGASLLAQGQQARGADILQQVLRDGDPAYLEYDLAYHELRRLGLTRPGEHRGRLGQ
jgi:tetratricopeptide (TPR) repeat protein